MIRTVLVLGGGSAGFLAAITLRSRFPQIPVTVLRSREIGIIGVGEGTTYSFPIFIHGALGIDPAAFLREANPSWKLGIRFLNWGPRPSFDYTFRPQVTSRWEQLPRPNGYYCQEDFNYADVAPSLMSHDRVFLRDAQGRPVVSTDTGYHIENEKFVAYLETHAQRLGVTTLDDTVENVQQNEKGITGLLLRSGRTVSADLYVDCSGFYSLLLGKTFQEPFISFKPTLLCDRAVVGGWARSDEPIKPYTAAETYNAGWCWQIEHENRINRGYVYSSDFISDSDAEAEFRSKNAKVTATRVVRFVSGRYQRTWVKNVVAIGNASGFVEPMEATALGMICAQSDILARCLADAGGEPGGAMQRHYNERMAGKWDAIRRFLAIHYRYNTRLETPFWQACREKVDLAGAEPIVDYYQEVGPANPSVASLLGPHDPFGLEGYWSLLIGQRVATRYPFVPTAPEMAVWQQIQARFKSQAMSALTIPEALRALRSPQLQWGNPYASPHAHAVM